MNVIYDLWLPEWAFAAVAIACACIAALSLWRNWKSGVFRTIALASLLALLANPLIRQDERIGLDDVALILVDKSGSQKLGDRDNGANRAAEALQAKLSALGGVETRLADITGDEETQTIAALQSALADIPRSRLGAVFVVTDGQASDAEQSIPGLNAPTHLIVAGDDREIDRKITLTNAPRYGIVDQPVRVSFRVDDLGPDEEPANTDQPVTVTLRVNGEEVLSEPVPLGVEAGFNAPLDRPGATVIELEVEARGGELTTRNNIAVLPITAIRDRLRVLLISGEPHPGERVWRNLLKSDPAVDLVHFTILRPIEKSDGVTNNNELALIQFPQDELFIQKLTEFDLLIFDRYTYRAVLDSFHFDNIARYVEGGGAVLIAAGPEYAGRRSLAGRRNLSFILPARPNGPAIERAFRPDVTDIGERHPVTAGLSEEEYWGRWLRIMPVEQDRGQALMQGPNASPLLILDRVGEGRVGLLLSDQVWLWARGFDGGGPHAELLRRIAHWLMKEPELEEEALSLVEDKGALVIRRRSIFIRTEPVTLEFPNGDVREIEPQEIEPGLFSARIEDAPRGLYRGRSGQLFAIGTVGLATAPEFQDVVSTTHKLKPLAKATRGGVFRTDARGSIPDLKRVGSSGPYAGDQWAGIVKRGAARIEAVRDAPVAPPLAWLILVAAALLTAWLIESGRLSRKRSKPTDQI